MITNTLDEIKMIYSSLEEVPKESSGLASLSDYREVFMASFENAFQKAIKTFASELDPDSYQEDESEIQSEETSPLITREEIHERRKLKQKEEELIRIDITMRNSQKINPLNYEVAYLLSDTELVGKSYDTFSFDTFVAYIYWRTQLRKNNIVGNYSAFYAVYIKDIFLCIECNTPSEAVNRLYELKNLIDENADKISDSSWINKCILAALEYIRILYSDYLNSIWVHSPQLAA